MKIDTYTATINHLKIYYTATGDRTKPVLVFLHAWGAHLGSQKFLNGTTPIIKELAKDFFVIAPEHPGLMRSQTPIQLDWSFNDYANTLSVLMAELSLKKPIIVGNSFGGSIATLCALQNPENIGKLVLVDSGVSKEYPRSLSVQKSAEKYTKMLNASYIPTFYKKFLIWLHQGKPMDLLTKEETRHEIMLAKKFDRSFKVDYTKINVPTLLLWGTADTIVHPLQDARKVARLIPAAKLVEYPGTVDTIYKNPQLVADLIRQNI